MSAPHDAARAAAGRWAWLGAAGLVLMPIGLAAIVLGWYGAARTPLEVEQTPYVVSGGLLGLGLVVTGGALFTGAAIAAAAQRRAADTDRLLAALVRPAAPAAAPVEQLVVTPYGDLVHRTSCAVVARRDDLVVVPAAPDLRACALCRPELAAAC
jgi:hypothetical protein